MSDEYEFELSVARDDAAAMLRALGDGVAAGSVRLGDDDLTVDVPEWVDAEVEYEVADDVELEVELTWHRTAADETRAEARAEAAESDSDRSTPGTDSTDRTDEADAPSVGGAESESSDGDGEASETGESDEPGTAPSAAVERGVEGDAESVAVGENPARLVGAADAGAAARESKARFELFRDSADEWRWRLVHRNGNIIADSGEGYSRKSDSRNGLRSVMRNAPGAAVVEDESD